MVDMNTNSNPAISNENFGDALRVIEAGIAEFGINNQKNAAGNSPVGAEGNFDPDNITPVGPLVQPAGNTLEQTFTTQPTQVMP